MKLIKSIIFSMLIFSSTYSLAEPLPQDSPELKQLIAMGFDIVSPKKDSKWTLAKSSNSTILVQKNEDTVLFVRLFTRVKLSDSDENKLLKVVNKINVDLTYQVALNPESLGIARYQTGPFNPKVFAEQIRFMEQIDYVLEGYRKDNLFELLNGK